MNFILKIITIPVLSCTILGNLYTQDDSKLFRDSLDGAFDISKWLFDLHGFLPVISPITEPAVGYGLVGAGIYFIPKKKPSGGKFRMPDIAGIGGGIGGHKFLSEKVYITLAYNMKWLQNSFY